MGITDFPVLRNKGTEGVPGPGQYAVPSDFDPKKPPGRAASIRGRGEIKAGLTTGTNELVGPGSYAIPAKIGDLPGGKLSFAPHQPTQGRASEGSRPGTPRGPGNSGPAAPPSEIRQYSMALNPTTPRYSFGTKLSSPTRERPGEDGDGSHQQQQQLTPRQYVQQEMEEQRQKSPRQRDVPTWGSRTTRSAVDVPSIGPGPCGYDVPRFGDHVPASKPVPHRAVEGERDLAKKGNEPGPGAYEVNRHTIVDEVKPRHRGHHTHGTMAGRNFPPVAHAVAPGPGAYSDAALRIGTEKKQGRSILGRFTEYTDMDDIYPRPAPGDYRIPGSFDKPGGSKGFTFGLRYPEVKPPDYSADLGEASGRERKDIDLNRFGMAEAIIHSSRGPKFNANLGFGSGIKTTASRGKDGMGNTPRRGPPKAGASTARGDGPADGANLSFIKPRPPAFTMGCRTTKASETEASGPGPGSYDVTKAEEDRRKGRGITFYRSPTRV